MRDTPRGSGEDRIPRPNDHGPDLRGMGTTDRAREVYAERHSMPEADHLRALAAATRAGVHAPDMLSGHLQGRFLSLLAHLVRPRIAVEIGTFTGYGSICLAEGLAPGGMLHTIDIDPHLQTMAARHIALAGMSDRITQHLAPARAVLPTLPGPFDLVFIDADKPGYPAYFQAVVDRVRPGGLIIADNVLWDGRVLLPRTEQDEVTRALASYNELVAADHRVEVVMIPLRDGLSVARRK